MRVQKILCVLMAILVCCTAVSCANKNSIADTIMDYMDENCGEKDVILYLADFTDFKWDKMMIFNYPTSAEEVETALGVKYDNAMDLISGMIFVRDGEIVYDEIFEHNYVETAKFYAYPQEEINAKPNYRIFLKEEAYFLAIRNENGEGYYYRLYPYEGRKGLGQGCA